MAQAGAAADNIEEDDVPEAGVQTVAIIEEEEEEEEPEHDYPWLARALHKTTTVILGEIHEVYYFRNVPAELLPTPATPEIDDEDKEEWAEEYEEDYMPDSEEAVAAGAGNKAATSWSTSSSRSFRQSHLLSSPVPCGARKHSS